MAIVEEILLQKAISRICDTRCICNEWNCNTVPKPFENYFYVDNNKIVLLYFDTVSANFGTTMKAKLDTIQIAYRDGKKEYELLESQIKRRRNKERCFLLKEKMVPFCNTKAKPNKIIFDDFLLKVDYETIDNSLSQKYVVLDVETNGLSSINNDLLSISIYDPSQKVCYNRLLPLEKQPVVFTGWINGIETKTLEDKSPITQEEWDAVETFFDLKNKTILTFSSGKGDFDIKFVSKYLKRHKIKGFENIQHKNIKSMVPKAPYGCEGQVTKDNLCSIFGIDGVTEKHTGFNDCMLEWKLFEFLSLNKIFFSGHSIYKVSPEYIVPVTTLVKWPKELIDYIGITEVALATKHTEVFRYSLPKKVLEEAKKFPNNITGMALEHGVNCELGVEEQDNFIFLVKNKSKLEKIGQFKNNFESIYVIAQEDGTYKAQNEEDEEYLKEVNRVTKLIIDNLKPMFTFIENDIFGSKRIMSQELVVSEDGKVLALCDLSTEDAVLEIKTFDVLDDSGNIYQNLKKQLYYESRERKKYVLSIEFKRHKARNHKDVIDDISAVIYQVEFLQEKV